MGRPTIVASGLVAATLGLLALAASGCSGESAPAPASHVISAHTAPPAAATIDLRWRAAALQRFSLRAETAATDETPGTTPSRSVTTLNLSVEVLAVDNDGLPTKLKVLQERFDSVSYQPLPSGVWEPIPNSKQNLMPPMVDFTVVWDQAAHAWVSEEAERREEFAKRTKLLAGRLSARFLHEAVPETSFTSGASLKLARQDNGQLNAILASGATASTDAIHSPKLLYEADRTWHRLDVTRKLAGSTKEGQPLGMTGSGVLRVAADGPFSFAYEGTQTFEVSDAKGGKLTRRVVVASSERLFTEGG